MVIGANIRAWKGLGLNALTLETHSGKRPSSSDELAWFRELSGHRC